MIIPTGPADKASGITLQKIYKVNSTSAVDRVSQKDTAMISNFSALVEHARTRAMAVPDIRNDRVAQVRSALENGATFTGNGIASAMINNAVEGQV